MSDNVAWRVTLHSPGDRQTVAALVAECRHRLAGHLDDTTVASVCRRLWDLALTVPEHPSRGMRLRVSAENAAAVAVARRVEPSLFIEGVPSAGSADPSGFALAS